MLQPNEPQTKQDTPHWFARSMRGARLQARLISIEQGGCLQLHLVPRLHQLVGRLPPLHALPQHRVGRHDLLQPNPSSPTLSCIALWGRDLRVAVVVV